jgi:iron complex outermembrane receptor protein
MSRFKVSVCLLAAASTLLATMPVLAADAAAGAKVTELEEVTVTAQRKEESLSKTPVAVAVVSAEALVQAQVVSEQDLRTVTPGLTIRAGLNSNQLNYSLRGESKDTFSGTRPGVLAYVNEVQIGGTGGSSAFYDLQSVQVLKGPQGTLFGRSATGGAVLFTTAKPTDELGGYFSALGGDYGATKIEGAISGPIAGDVLKGRLAGFYQKRDGFQKNLFDGGREGDMKRFGFRGSLTAKLGDKVNNALVVDYLKSDSESTIGVISGLLPFLGGGAGNPPYIPIQFLYAGTATPLASATGIGTLQAFLPPAFAAFAAPFYNGYFANPKHPNGGISAFLAAQQARGPYVINSDASNIYDAKDIVVSNTTTFEVGTDSQLKNIIGYVKLKSAQAFEADGTPYAISGNGPKGTSTGFVVDTKQVSDEIQLLGKAAGGKLSYVTGLYFSDEKVTNIQHSEFFDLILGGQVQLNDFMHKNKTAAVYGQGTYNLNDSGLALTAGLRYTNEKVELQILPTDSVRVALGNPAPPGFSYDKSNTFKKLSWQLGLQDQVNDSWLVYGVTRRAFKSGGYNGSVAPRNGSAAIAGDEYGAEQVTDAEFGTKFQGDVAGKPVRMNIALFNNWVVNSQRTAYSLVFGNPAALTVNVPKGKTYGVELDAQIKATNNLTLGGTLNYTHATFNPDTVFVNGSAQIFDQVTDTPQFSGSLFADLSFPISHYALTLHGDAYNQDKTFTAPRSSNNLGTLLDSYTLANFRVGLEDSNAHWSVTANLKNAFDKTYFVGSLPTGEIYQINVAVPGEPRTVTLEARYKF